MKSRYSVLLVMAIFAGLYLSSKAIAGNRGSGDHGGSPLALTGPFSSTTQGSFALCLDPTSFALESCGTSGVLAVPQSFISNGVGVADDQGNSCVTATDVESDLPLDASPPIITKEHNVAKTTNYDSTTGTGDGSFIGYTGGSCNGAVFDSTGATEISSGTFHSVVTNNGNRVDVILTKLTNPTGSIGDFSLSGTDLRQTR